MSIEKGYAVNNSNRKTIKSGFEKIGKGGFSFNVFNSLFGAQSEVFNKSENVIQKEELKKKIKKYLDFNGLITFGVFLKIYKIGHAFSVIGYKEYQDDEFYIEVLNPYHKGRYLENNIKKNDEYNESLEEIKNLFDSEKKGKNIYEEEFKNNQEIYDIFNNYEKTGFLTMKLDTFFNWFKIICFCDPMLGYLESIVEINKGENCNNRIYFTITDRN
jgi:glutaredoxin-related protein